MKLNQLGEGGGSLRIFLVYRKGGGTLGSDVTLHLVEVFVIV